MALFNSIGKYSFVKHLLWLNIPPLLKSCSCIYVILHLFTTKDVVVCSCLAKSHINTDLLSPGQILDATDLFNHYSGSAFPFFFHTVIAEMLPQSFCISLLSQETFLMKSLEFMRSKYVMKRDLFLHSMISLLSVGKSLGTL